MIESKTIGFIGGGNMAEAIVKGLISGGVPSESIMISEPLPFRRNFLSSEYAAIVTDDNLDVARRSDIIVLAVKPQIAASVLSALEPVVSGANLIVSIMAGISTTYIENILAKGIHVVRAMPNTAALVRSAATAICAGRNADNVDMALARSVFEQTGVVIEVSEKQMDAVTGLSGSGPAYVCTFMEALSDAGVKNGLTREASLELALQTVLGTALMIRETGEHPALLREKVASPGGTTIAAIHELEKGGFRGIVMSAVDASCARARELSAAG